MQINYRVTNKTSWKEKNCTKTDYKMVGVCHRFHILKFQEQSCYAHSKSASKCTDLESMRLKHLKEQAYLPGQFK